MNAFKDVLFPSVLNILNVDVGAKLVMFWHICEFNYDVYRGATFKCNETVCAIFPFFELPFHFDFFVFLEGSVRSLDSVSEHLMFATYFQFRNAWGLGKLAQSHLVSEGSVYDFWGTVVSHFNFGLLAHFVLI